MSGARKLVKRCFSWKIGMKSHGAPAVVAENVDQVIRVEEALISRRSFTERIAEQFAIFIGTMYFVAGQVIFFAAWVLINAGYVDGLKPFDPYPYSLFSSITSFEAIIVTAVVLMKQNRQDVIADRREHLDLQVSLLTEREVTQVIRMLDKLGDHFGISTDHMTKEYARPVSVDTMVNALHDKMPQETKP